LSNDYFNADTLISRQTKAKSPAVNAIIQSIAAGFDLFPGKDKLQQDRVTHYPDTGAADAYVVTMAPAITAYADGLSLRVVIANTNTGASTLNVNGIGARAIKLFNNTDPAAGDITAGDICVLVYQSSLSAFIMISQSRSYVASAQTAAEAAAAAQEAAETAQGAAEEAQAGAETALDSFDDRYLGEKASDPTTDNDGDPLLVGAIYWKTGSGFRVWNGSAWSAAFFDANGALVAANNLSDLTDAEAALDNLGLQFSNPTTTATASPYEQVAADVSGGAWTLSLPAAPAAGDWVRVAVVSGNPETNNLTVSGNGNTINGDASLIMDALYVQVSLIFNGTEWRIC
jgi:hypothetical protein